MIVTILREVDNKLSAKAIGSLYANLSIDDASTSQVFLETLEKYYNAAEFYYKSKYLRVFSRILVLEDSLQSIRVERFLSFQFRLMNYSKYTSDVEQIINYLYKLATKSVPFRRILSGKTNEMQWLQNWITSNMKMVYTNYKTAGVQQQEEFIKPTYQVLLKKCQKLAQGEAPNDEREWDSDDDLIEEDLKKGEIDILEQSGHSYMKVKIEAVIGELIWLSAKSSGGEQWVWKDTQSEELAPAGSRSSKGYINSS